MASINSLPEGVQVILTPGEILHLPYTSENGTSRDAIRVIAWKLLNIHGKKVVRDKVFTASVTELVNGEFATIFLYDRKALDTPPVPE